MGAGGRDSVRLASGGKGGEGEGEGGGEGEVSAPRRAGSG